jgi:hypothetical protein
VPLVAYLLFRREKPQLTRHLLLTSAIFALSFVFVEGAAAIYLGAAGLLPGILARSPMSRDYPPIFSGRRAGTLTICRSAC